MMKGKRHFRVLLLALILIGGCGTSRNMVHIREDMDFSFIKRVAVLPFKNLSGVANGDEIIRQLVISELLVAGYTDVEVPGDATDYARSLGVKDIHSPSEEEIRKIGKACKVQAVVFGTVEQWANVQEGSGSRPEITLTIMMADATSGRIIWSVTRSQNSGNFLAEQLGLSSYTMTEAAMKAVRSAVRTLSKY